MALLSRFGCLSNHSCKNALISTIKRFSFHHFIDRKAKSPDLCFTQTIPYLQQRYQSTNEETKQKKDATSTKETPTGNKLSQRTRLKQAVRDYGATIIVFHIALSLTSLGFFYILVSSGVDAPGIILRLSSMCSIPESFISNKIAVGGTTFVMAYAVHKAFAPIRIAMTLTFAPLLVRYLRKINLIKPPK